MNKKNHCLSVAMISEHGDPIAPLGGQQSGGQNVYVYELARALSKLNIRVDVFTRWESRKTAQIVRFAKRAKVIRLKAGPRNFISKDKYGPLMPEFIEHFLEYTHSKKIKYDLIHCHYYYSGWVGMQLKNILNIPMVTTFHSLGLVKHKALKSKDTSPDERIKIEKEIVKNTDKIIAVAPQEKVDLVTDYRAGKRKIEIVPPGVNLRRFTSSGIDKARKKLGISLDKKVIVFAGKMERRKGGLTLIAAVREIKKHQPQIYKDLEVYMFTGDKRKARRKEKKEADAYHDLQQAVSRMQVENSIKLLSAIEQDELHYYYSAANVVVMPSYYEPFGMVAVEAMASGTPVVVSNVGGLKWNVQEGVTGFHARVKDPKDFANKILKILRNPDLRDKLSKNAIKRANQNFDWDIIAEQILKIYKDLTKIKTKK